MPETIEKIYGADEVVCEQGDAPGRSWDCDLKGEFGESIGLRDEYYVDEFSFPASDNAQGVKSRRESIVAKFKRGANCELKDINGLIELSCD